MASRASSFTIEHLDVCDVLRLTSDDGTNRLTRACVMSLNETVCGLRPASRPLIVAGNHRFFSAGADLHEIAALTGPAALEFSALGQELMHQLATFPAPVYAAIEGYCMGGGLDFALACRRRVASPHAVFGHRGAALGLITGWGGTQRLPRLIGKAKALELLIAAEKLNAAEAQRLGLIDDIAEQPEQKAVQWAREAISAPTS